MELGKKLKEKRLEADYTQKELADILHVSRQTISSWEVGRTFPDLMTLVTLSELYDVPLDNLVKEDSRLVDDITQKVTRSERRKVTNIVLSLLLVVATVSLVFFAYQNYLNSQTNAQGLHPNDLYDSHWEVHFDPTHSHDQSFLSFSNDSAVVLNQYRGWPADESLLDELDDDVLSSGLEAGVHEFDNLNISVFGQHYIVSADGLQMEFTRLSDSIIRNSEGIEFYRVQDESAHDSLFWIHEQMTEGYE
ncbi:MAG: helix-turn-helix transcriptional regulator [Alkalibacterium sp.]|nr:helix-turn-helix transcriptional regulator [Alkalibacterium sp.]